MEPAAHAAVAVGQRPFEGRADARPLAIALMGPTASGKTDLALEWAQRWPLELISVDSALVYRGMDIGSAKPDRDTLARVPHRLVDIRDPHQGWSAGEFARAARLAMDEIVAAGRVPLLVGGTGLYFRALLDGFSSLPQADAAMRARIEHEGSERGWAALHAELAAVDAAAAARIAPADRQRIGRALEVFRLSGQPISTLQAGVRSPFPYRVLRLAVAPAQRSVLHLRIVRRFDAMLGAGLLEEVRRLRQDPRLHPGLPSMRAVGYRQAWRHLDGATDAAQFRDEAIAATRQLAKRQLTWLRRELGAYWVDPAAAPGAAARAVAGFLGASSNRRGY